MVRFAHIADCHLGGWRIGELQELNFKSFEYTVDKCIEERVDFILIAGDLFDSAYPSIEILKNSFAQFKKIHDAKIPVYLIAGSHDFSASGKTFLDVLEHAGFCKNVEKFEVTPEGKLKLFPTMHEGIAIYGYPGRKSGMEIEDLSKVEFNSLGRYTIFMIHTTISDVVGSIPMDSISKEKLPLANYYAMGHIHQIYDVEISNSKYVYPGPTFPNNFQELSDLKGGSFCIVETDMQKTKIKRISIPTKDVSLIEIQIENGLAATDEIISKLDKLNLIDKIVLLKLKGILTQGKTADIRFREIEEFVEKKGASVFLKNISSLKMSEMDFQIEESSTENVENIEKDILREYSKKNPNDFNKYLPQLMTALSIEKQEDEKSAIYEDRLISELKDIFELKEIL